MWQQFKCCFQILNITNSTGQKHLAEKILKLKIIKVEKFLRDINNHGDISFGSCYHFNQIIVLSYLFSSKTHFKCWHLKGTPGCRALGKESISSPRSVALRAIAEHLLLVTAWIASPIRRTWRRP